MKLKSKLIENNIYFQYDLPWKMIKTVKWMNERATSNKAYVPTTVSIELLHYFIHNNFINDKFD